MPTRFIIYIYTYHDTYTYTYTYGDTYNHTYNHTHTRTQTHIHTHLHTCTHRPDLGRFCNRCLLKLEKRGLTLSQKCLTSNHRNASLPAPKLMRFPSKDRKLTASSGYFLFLKKHATTTQQCLLTERTASICHIQLS